MYRRGRHEENGVAIRWYCPASSHVMGLGLSTLHAVRKILEACSQPSTQDTPPPSESISPSMADADTLRAHVEQRRKARIAEEERRRKEDEERRRAAEEEDARLEAQLAQATKAENERKAAERMAQLAELERKEKEAKEARERLVAAAAAEAEAARMSQDTGK